MPAETRVLCSWANETARVEVDIDASNRVTAIRRVGDAEARAVLSRADRSRSYTLPRGSRSVTVGTGAAARLQLTYDAARDRYDGLTGEILTEG